MKKRPTPRIDSRAAEFYADRHKSMNNGAEVWLTAVPSLFHWTLQEIRGKFNWCELRFILDSMNGVELSPEIMNQQVAISVESAFVFGHMETAKTNDSSERLNRVDFPKKIRSLTHFQQACLAVWACGFWAGKREDMDEWMGPLLADDQEKGGENYEQ